MVLTNRGEEELNELMDAARGVAHELRRETELEQLSRRVLGTLRRGFDHYASLAPGFARSVFAMFLVAEVHPFADGNGRVARALANAELTAANQQRLMIPIVYRDDYLQALRALSRKGAPAPLLRTMARAQAWAQELDWSSMASAHVDLGRTHALLTPSEAEEQGVILRRPSELTDEPPMG
jgi:Fic/DOC family